MSFAEELTASQSQPPDLHRREVGREARRTLRRAGCAWCMPAAPTRHQAQRRALAPGTTSAAATAYRTARSSSCRSTPNTDAGRVLPRAGRPPVHVRPRSRHTDMLAAAMGMDPAAVPPAEHARRGRGRRGRHASCARSRRARCWRRRLRRRAGTAPRPGLRSRHRRLRASDRRRRGRRDSHGRDRRHVQLMSPTVDMGTGTHTIMDQLVARGMGLPLDNVRVVVGDTDKPRTTKARGPAA